MTEQNTKSQGVLSLMGIYNFFLKGSIYLLIFLLPVFFLPFTSNILDFNKQGLLIALVCVSLFAWILKSLASGSIKFSPSAIHIFVGAMLVIWIAATVFSSYQYGSFWGWTGGFSSSLLSFIGFVFLYLLISNVFTRKEIGHAIFIFIASAFLAVLFAIVQLFGKFLIPFDFAKVASFNTIGSVNSLGIFAAVILPLIIFMLVGSKKLSRIFLVFALIADAAVLIFVNFSVAWIAAVVGSGIILILALQKRKFFDNRWLVLPMFFLAISILFMFFSFRIPGLASRPIEVFLKQKAGFDIATQTLKQKSVLGSGPETFIFDFSKFKDQSINSTALWNIRLDNAGSKVINTLSETGVLGTLSFVALLLFSIFSGAMFLVSKKSNILRDYAEDNMSEMKIWLLASGIFSSFVVLAVSSFFYATNFVLEFSFFCLLGCFVALLYPVKKEIVLKSSSLATLGITFLFTVVFIFSLGILILEGQRYTADVFYASGLNAWSKGDTDGAISNITKAVSINQQEESYWRDISQIYLQKIGPESSRTDISKDELTQKLQALIKNAVFSAQNASNLNPNNVADRSVLGFVYQNLIGIVPGIEDSAVKAYEDAISLEPLNPYFSTQQGIVYLAKYSISSSTDKSQNQEQTTEQKQALQNAEEMFNRAISLKSDYALARFHLSTVYTLQGKANEAINELEEAKKAAPFDTGIAFQLGLIYYQDKQYEKAQVEFERAISINSSYANAIYFSGLTYDKLGQKDKAIEKIETVEKLNPDNEEIKKVLDNLKSGRDALYGIESANTPVTTSEQSPEGAKSTSQNQIPDQQQPAQLPDQPADSKNQNLPKK